MGFASRFCIDKYMTPVSKQLDTDSCISFTLSAALGASVALTHNLPVASEFSNQEIVDCLPIRSEGTSYEAGYDYVLMRGLHLNKDYPYMGEHNLPCWCFELQGREKHSFMGVSWSHPETTILRLYERPITAGMRIYEGFMRHTTRWVSADDLMGVYSPSVVEEPTRDYTGNIDFHAVLVIGFGIENGELYFIIKNWWGVKLVVNGYTWVAAHLLFYFGFPIRQ